MAINKVVNKSTKCHGAMRNVLKYVLRNDKVKEGYVELVGPYSGETINYDDVYKSWIHEKKLWGKDSGRMYTHNIISFHKDEQVSPKEVLEIGKAFAEKFFPNHQYVVGVHQDKDHLHCHIVTNSVSYIDGGKLHQTKRDLERQKVFTNDLCLERGLSVTKKGHHFDGRPIEQGEITSWGKDKYNLLLNAAKKSFVAECAIALIEVIPQSTNREEFISGMEERGWSVQWEDSRKHIVFKNSDGKKIRDSNIEKTFAGLEVSKEALLNEFTRQNELRLSHLPENEGGNRADPELERYYEELEAAVSGLNSAKAVRNDQKTIERDTQAHQKNTVYEISNGSDQQGSESVESIGKTRRYRRDTESFIRKLDSQEEASGQKRDYRISERENREIARERSRITAKRNVAQPERRAEADSTRNRSKRGVNDIER